MLDLVDVGELAIQSYRGTAPDHILDDLNRAAEGLRGGDEAFFRVTKAIHNGLQGAAQAMTDQEKAMYEVRDGSSHASSSGH